MEGNCEYQDRGKWQAEREGRKRVMKSVKGTAAKWQSVGRAKARPYMAAIFIFALALLVPSPARSQTNALTPGKPNGLYGNPDGTLPRFLIFFPDGRVHRGIPNASLNGFDDAYWMATDIRSGMPKLIAPWGTFTVSGSQGSIVFIKNRETWPFKIFPDHLEVRGHSYYLLDPGAGVRLNGTFQPEGDTSKSITFKPDGGVVDNGVTANCGSNFSLSNGHPSVGPGVCTDKARIGRYSTVSYGLRLTFPSGNDPTPTLLFWLDPGARGGDIRVIYIDKVKYQRVE